MKLNHAIITKGRIDYQQTAKIIDCPIFCPESEKKALSSKFLKREIITYPDQVKGLNRVRNFVLNYYENQPCFIYDDDIEGLYYVALPKAVKTIGTMKEVIDGIFVICRDIDCKVFGVSRVNTNVMMYSKTNPFSLCGSLSGGIGIIGGRKFRDDLVCKIDVNHCMEEINLNRRLFIDNRYSFLQKISTNTGGNSAYRTSDQIEKEIKILRNTWGGQIRLSSYKSCQKTAVGIINKQRFDLL